MAECLATHGKRHRFIPRLHRGLVPLTLLRTINANDRFLHCDGYIDQIPQSSYSYSETRPPARPDRSMNVASRTATTRRHIVRSSTTSIPSFATFALRYERLHLADPGGEFPLGQPRASALLLQGVQEDGLFRRIDRFIHCEPSLQAIG